MIQPLSRLIYGGLGSVVGRVGVGVEPLTWGLKEEEEGRALVDCSEPIHPCAK